MITATDIRDAIARQLSTIVDTVRGVLERTPPETTADVMQRGIHLSGGGALIPGFPEVIQEALQVPVVTVPDPLRAVIRGAGLVVEQLDQYEEVLIDNDASISPFYTD